MSKKLYLLASLCCISSYVLPQQQVSKAEVEKAAVYTLVEKAEILNVSVTKDIDAIWESRSEKGHVLMYEVVFKNRAAVLLSGSRACEPVLGYYIKGDDKESIFDTNNLHVPCGLRAMVEGYAQEIEWCFSQDTLPLYYLSQWQELQKEIPRKNRKAGTVIGPLLTTKWGQNWSNDGVCDAYNYYVTKTDKHCAADCASKHCPVGCTAVAMGQIMNYWKYPVYLLNKAAGQYDWCYMPNRLYSYLPNYERERNAIARLLIDCAESVNATFCIGKCETSAAPIKVRRALVEDFQYHDDAVFRLRSSHPAGNVWKNYIKTDLNNGRPVLYASLSFILTLDAHVFVCDGYNENDDKFHFNWGWWGSFDTGWYALNGLGNIGGSNYNVTQEAVFQIYPNLSQNYCNYSMPLWVHYAMYYNVLGETFPPPFLNVPYTFNILESVPGDWGLPTQWHTISSGELAVYSAHEKVIFRPGFKVEAGGRLIARIDPCPGCNTANQSVVSSSYNGEAGYGHFLTDSAQTLPNMPSQNGLSDDPQSKHITIYPNPNDGTFTLSTNFDPQEIVSIRIFNLLGNTVFEQNGIIHTQITLPNPTAGMYFLKAILQSGIITQKFVVQ
jgi:hypothetical protein